MSLVKLKMNNIKLIVDSRICFAYLLIGRKAYNFSSVFIVTSKVRKLFPYLMWVSFWDCDSARYYAGHKFFAWNYKDLLKKQTQLNRYSDGTLFTEFKSITQYLKA